MSKEKILTEDELRDLVAETDTGGRAPAGFIGYLILLVAILWSLFQLYFASPLPFILQKFLFDLGITSFNVVIDDTKARSIHLAFAIFLAFMSYPAFKSSSRHKIPLFDFILAIVGAFCASYYLFFYQSLFQRFGAPNLQDIIVAFVGIFILLEATRRSLGLPLVIIASAFLLYNYFGQFFPTNWIISHNQGSLSRIADQIWITTEGVFGIALGVSTKYVFLFVLFGAMLERAGAGNYFIKAAFAYLGHLRGGPAKAAVVSSACTGVISGSSIANVVTTGTFTIPMMKKVGFKKEQAGAVEVSSSVNGQLMPPVMGAAAFLMVEYVNIPYNQLVTYAFLPAVISYIALVYIVHLQALKLNLPSLARSEPINPIYLTFFRLLGTIITVGVLYFIVDYGLGWIKIITPNYSFAIVLVILFVVYLLLLYRVSKFPDLELEEAAHLTHLPKVKPTINSGWHYLLPVTVLLWCLMIERLSPGLSAFWGSFALIGILITQRPLLKIFRNQKGIGQATKIGIADLINSLINGARNMIGIGIATACAGIIVGVVSLTSFGIQLSGIIESLSGGNILLMLILVAVFSLILGMGLPTTANYIVVSSLMALVIVEVGGQNGLIVPLIAVHLFVFYFGIMADVTPPVGLASFAAAAISGGSPIKTGLIAFAYSLRTAILPFLFIFNTNLILYNVGFTHGLLVFIAATIAMLAFSSVTMNYALVKNKIWESIVLLIASFMLFNPGFLMKYISPPNQIFSSNHIEQAFANAQPGSFITLKVAGHNAYGVLKTFYTQVEVANGNTAAEKIANTGLILNPTIDKMIIDEVAFDSNAAKAGLEWDQVIFELDVPRNDNLAQEWIFIPGFLLVLLIYFNQLIRRRKQQITS